jgi:hypothetical protein
MVIEITEHKFVAGMENFSEGTTNAGGRAIPVCMHGVT